MPAKQRKAEASEESPTAFKHLINPLSVERMAKSLRAIDSTLDLRPLRAAKAGLAALELRQRSHHVRDALRRTLPTDYAAALALIRASVHSGTLKGFEMWPYFDYIQAHGLDDFDRSLEMLRELTPYFTAEFAVRPYLTRDPTRAYARLARWVDDPNEHVRRWVSEGTRPRLPWGERLVAAVRDPSDGLALLEHLRHDDSLYVRKSVANHLNDISKDHPERVITTLASWARRAPAAHAENISWITRHALRSLVKAGHRGALRLLGAGEIPKVKVAALKLARDSVRFPGELDFAFELHSTSKRSQRLIVDYVIHHCRPSGKASAKVFKLKTIELKAGEQLSIHKRHPLRPITTRSYHSGKHVLEIQVNGEILARREWKLVVR